MDKQTWLPTVTRTQTVAEFLATMKQQHDLILSRAKIRQLQRKKSSVSLKEKPLSEVSPVNITSAQKKRYLLQNLRIDHQFNVHKLQVELGLDAEQFAQQAGLSLARLAEIQAGKAVPTMEEMLQLALLGGKSLKFKFE